MLNPNTRLLILHDDDGTFHDYTNVAHDFARDPFDLSLDASDDYLYIGYYKRIAATYVAIEDGYMGGEPNEFTAEYWNGSSWDALEGFHDDTQGFTRSGFIQWNRNQGATNTSTQKWQSTSVNGEDAFWIRLRPSETQSSQSIMGINILFADDEDLKNIFPTVGDAQFLQEQPTHIRFHVAARDAIIQRFRNKDYVKRSSIVPVYTQKTITAWDLLDIDEVRQGAAYLALSQIMFNSSDSAGDVWSQKALYYEKLYHDQISLARLSVDANDDGITQEAEKVYSLKTRFMQR